MKAISLWQPWASAMALGSKRIETRSWATSYRGWIGIHAAKHCVKAELTDLLYSWHWHGALRATGVPLYGGKVASVDALIEVLPFGAVVAVGNLVGCRPTESFTEAEIDVMRTPAGAGAGLLQWKERLMGDFSSGRYGWVFDEIIALPEPIKWKGKQGFFEVPDELLGVRL